jgi:GT2 family glycosyltransferase/SAM-dependent methyltransferase
MPENTKHQRAHELVNENRLDDAVKLLSEALGEAESAELWNDWATIKMVLEKLQEAYAGYERALELEPENAQVQFNLGVLMIQANKLQRGVALLQKCNGRVTPQEQLAVNGLLQQYQNAASNADYAVTLEEFAPATGAAKEYFATHRDRYLACLELLPQAKPGQTLLELGASFHHLTPALESKGYKIYCSDIWDGEPSRDVQLVNHAGTNQRHYKVDNFDVQQQRWPYEDGSFDAVLLCEMLEHLNTDPIHVLAEINRILKKDGLLLLTTPNIASAKSVNYVLEGNSPYVFGQYVPGGLPTDRHNREFTASEINRLLTAAGFQTVALETRNSWWKDQNNALAKLAAMGQSIANRGDNVFALARKSDAVQDRYPEEFYCRSGSQAENRNQIEKNGKRILLVHDVLPHFDRSGSDMRLLQVIHRLLAAGHEITYIARNDINRDKYEAPLKELGVTVFCGDAEKLAGLNIKIDQTWKFETVLKNGSFDVAIFFHWYWSGIAVTEHYLDDVRKLSPNTKVVVLTDDRHGIREWRMADLSNHSTDRERALDYLVREVSAYRAADLVLAITEDDRQGLMEMSPDLPIELLPMTAETHESKLGYDERQDFVFLANFDNLANRDAVSWFCDEVWSRIRKRLPQATLYIAGNNIPAEMSKRWGVQVLGHVADLNSTLEKYRVFVSPIRFGTGIKTKNLTALGNGIPLITTTIGAEGMNLTNGENAIIEDSAGAFANKAVELYNNREQWEKLATNGRKHIETEFSTARLDSQIARIMERLETITPHEFDPEHRFSIRVVEELYPESLTAPLEGRLTTRVMGYVNMAEKLAGLGHHAEAMEQLRHIFYHVRGPMPRNLFFARVLTLMEGCYREMNDKEAAKRCGEEAKLCLPELNPAFVKDAKKKSKDLPNIIGCAISVIIPTYNRRATLDRCLQALAAQTLSPSRFEVVIVDDGSTDDTQEFLSKQQMPFNLSVYQQKNQGPGAARKLAVEQAKGKYLLLTNDDTIADPNLLKEHLHTQLTYQNPALAVLGTFEYEQPKRRALTHFLSVNPFLFPQCSMNPGVPYPYNFFVTCNISIERETILKAGSFDASLRVAEDTDIGYRLQKLGCKVIYNPEAKAIHDHAEISVEDLVRRAHSYGRNHVGLLKKHPDLTIKTTAGELGASLTAADIEQIKTALQRKRAEIEETVSALKQYDAINFEQYFDMPSEQGTMGDTISELFSRAIPEINRFYLLEGFCAAWTQKNPAPAFKLVSPRVHA